MRFGRKRHCSIRDCKNEISPSFLICGDHFAMMSRDIRDRLWFSYVPGGKRDDKEWASFVAEMQAVVDTREAAPKGG